MIKRFLMLCLILNAFVAQAHQPDNSSTALIERADGTWVLQIKAALIAFEYEVERKFGKNAFANPEEFKVLVNRHLMDNIWIEADQESEVVLDPLVVKLGHETNVVFKILGLPESIQNLRVKNTSFQNIYKNQSALIILKNGFSNKEQFVLNAENNHAADLIASDSKFLLASNTNNFVANNQALLLSMGLLILLLSSAFLGLKKRGRSGMPSENKKGLLSLVRT